MRSATATRAPAGASGAREAIPPSSRAPALLVVAALGALLRLVAPAATDDGAANASTADARGPSAVQEVRGSPVVRASDESGSAAAREAIALCESTAGAAPEARPAIFARGLALAERAIADDERDAKAHFAIFCNLGREMDLAGLSLSAAARLGRLRRAVARAVELEPHFVDALLGKGSLLANTPWLLGGDAAEGERLIRAAVALAPADVTARLELARVLEARGAREEAIVQARAAAELAERQPGDAAEDLAEARRIVARLSP